MASNTVSDLEAAIVTKGYTIVKKYDGHKGICHVTLERKVTGTVITTQNTSNSPLWVAYKRALEFGLSQIQEFERNWGKTP